MTAHETAMPTPRAIGDRIWLRCPLCTADAAFAVELIATDETAGTLTCLYGHRWFVAWDRPAGGAT